MSRLGSFWRKIGPGLVTGAADDDPAGVVIYSQVGAQTGFHLLWMALITFPLMTVVQEMCARIGLVTGHGLAGNLRRSYSRSLLIILVLLVVIGNTLNIGADIAAMAAATNLLIPVPEPILAIIYSGLIIFALLYSSYQAIANVLKWVALTLLVYLIVPFFVQTDWLAALQRTLVPQFSLSKENIALIVAVFGTTISPYLFFWQASMEVEDKAGKVNRLFLHWFVRKRELDDMKQDVAVGMLLSNVVMWFIIVTAAVALNANGVTNISTTREAAEALRPLAGDLAYIIFSLGVVSIGFLAIPVLAGSSSYALAETLNWKVGLNKKFHQAPQFYLVIIISTLVGLLIPLLGIDPIKALFFTGIFYGATAPILIFVILHVANNRRIMGKYVNSPTTNIVGYLTFFIMSVALLALMVL